MNEDLHIRWPHRWLTPKAEARPSSVQGIGVFAKEHISKGDPVFVLGGVIVHSKDIQDYRKAMDHIGLQIEDDFFIVPTTRKEVDEHGGVNHSCEPNLGLSGPIILVAIQDIAPGEECFFDYAFSETDFEAFDCGCGKALCRKRVGPEDWKKEDIQKKYGMFFSPYIQRKFNA